MSRKYLSIGEVLTLLQDEFPDVTISKIRFLESQGLIDPERTPSGYRKFYDGDVDRLRFILREQKDHFLPLRVIKDRLDNGEPVESAAPAPAVDTEEPAPEEPARVPIWMAAKATTTGTTTGASLTFDELAAAAGLTPEQLREVEQYGLITSTEVGRTAFFDEDALVAARLAAGFLRHGVEPRHLRMYRTSAEREAGLFEQVILPLVKQRNPQARADALQRLDELHRLGDNLRQAMLRQALKSYRDTG
jgi:DNA-binding transcriptional MerR regulator